MKTEDAPKHRADVYDGWERFNDTLIHDWEETTPGYVPEPGDGKRRK